MREKIAVDIREFSFDEFVAFWFDREVPQEKQGLNAWYRRLQVTFDVQKLSGYYVRLFREPRFLLERYTVDQLFQGFGAIESRCSCSMKILMWNTDLPFAAREECVRSMFYLFRDLFAVEPVSFTAHMWWDVFCFDYEIGCRRRSHGGEDLAMQDVLFATIVDVLAIDSEECRAAAIHGLSHLHHPETIEVLHRFVVDNPAVDRQIKRYALSVAMHERFWAAGRPNPQPRPPETHEEFKADLLRRREAMLVRKKEIRLLRRKR